MKCDWFRKRKAFCKSKPFTILFTAWMALGMGLVGCSTRGTISLATKTVNTTSSIAGRTALGAGKIASSTAVSITKAGISAGAGMATTGMVTFVDTATGIARQLPYAEGMKLYAASKTAEVDLALKSIQILRGTQKIRSKKADISLQPGDVIRLF